MAQRWHIGAFRTIAVAAALTLATTAWVTEEVSVSVKGMVCGFCVQALKKTFRDHPAVASVDVSLTDKLVRFVVKDGATLSDEEIMSGVRNAGYVPVSISRGNSEATHP